MAVELERYVWGKGIRERVPVNETVLQDMVDTMFRSTRLWETHPEMFERKLRQWQTQLWATEATSTTPAPMNPPVVVVEPASGPSVEARVEALAREGKSVSQIKAETGLSGRRIRELLPA